MDVQSLGKAHVWKHSGIPARSNSILRRDFSETLEIRALNFSGWVRNPGGAGSFSYSVLRSSYRWRSTHGNWPSPHFRICVQKLNSRKKKAIVSNWTEPEDDPSDFELQPRGGPYSNGLSNGYGDEAETGTPHKYSQSWTWNVMELIDRAADYADEQKEIGMRKRRAFYKADDWIRHRSSKRHVRHFLSSFSSRVIISLIPPVSTVTLIATIIAMYNSAVEDHLLPSFCFLLHTSSLPYQLTASALALLLVFRTEASYSRYDEGRKTWTKVFACTKDFARQTMSWIQHPQDSYRRLDLLHYIMSFPVALKCHLLDGSDIEEDLKLLLDEEDLALVLSSDHRPNCLIQLMTQSMGLVNLSDNQKSLMDANITQFNESVSVCERIVRTPIPLSYTRLTSRALVLWHLTLPVVLWDDCGWMVIFATFFSACTLFCIEEVGVLIEEPFPVLSLDKMCAVAHENVQEFVELQEVTNDYLVNKEKMMRGMVSMGPARVGTNGSVPGK
ncbi:ion channel-forming bestrophin family protein [Marchantia polymorpha subsp. ruderalis]|uniref:Uncharacterized protein n=2 Tax=Marchantia polymorpha TaxID=3197 RepID=A0A176VSX8_MARPO|nr:hypothetical protein AXG93_1217s1310 [Marchantia polymorpha subsp. ruderalis]PTQ35420.1 hypothetical protein MARPO_0071s0037 [Marchantia polymorpha]BBN11900.1 hypothetical protein Mp_5g15730 [Marchantia polymorpha subsp. ruderalis]|eukprot:PTQ35420.1 hypothetical protein MARPO_0071s0037 [Marchantia polymorpha]